MPLLQNRIMLCLAGAMIPDFAKRFHTDYYTQTSAWIPIAWNESVDSSPLRNLAVYYIARGFRVVTRKVL